MTVSDDPWRPACGACGSTSLAPSPGGYRCGACAAPWDGSEAPEPVRASPEGPDDELDSTSMTTTISACEKGNP